MLSNAIECIEHVHVILLEGAFDKNRDLRVGKCSSILELLSCIIYDLLRDLDADKDLTYLGFWIRVHHIDHKITAFVKAKLLELLNNDFLFIHVFRSLICDDHVISFLGQLVHFLEVLVEVLWHIPDCQ